VIPADAAVTDWTDYLDALESAVLTMDDQLLHNREPVAGTLAGLVAPSSALPDRLLDRRNLLLAMLYDVTGRAIAHRDALAAEIAALPRRRAPRPLDAAATLGSTLDIVG
jgi:hypothetical protein